MSRAFDLGPWPWPGSEALLCVKGIYEWPCQPQCSSRDPRLVHHFLVSHWFKMDIWLPASFARIFHWNLCLLESLTSYLHLFSLWRSPTCHVALLHLQADPACYCVGQADPASTTGPAEAAVVQCAEFLTAYSKGSVVPAWNSSTCFQSTRQLFWEALNFLGWSFEERNRWLSSPIKYVPILLLYEILKPQAKQKLLTYFLELRSQALLQKEIRSASKQVVVYTLYYLLWSLFLMSTELKILWE
jgi:hypothetical protein